MRLASPKAHSRTRESRLARRFCSGLVLKMMLYGKPKALHVVCQSHHPAASLNDKALLKTDVFIGSLQGLWVREGVRKQRNRRHWFLDIVEQFFFWQSASPRFQPGC